VKPLAVSPSVLVAVVALSLTGCRSVEKGSAPELPSGRQVTIQGHQMFVRETGQGPNVVLLHGLGDSTVGWQFLEPELVNAGYRVTAWDALGAGRSDKPRSGDYSIDAHVRRLNDLMNQLELRQAVLVGHSLGGSVALRFAAQHPDKVQALCLIDPAAYRAGATGDRWFWNTPLLAETVLGVVPTSQIIHYGLRQNFHQRDAISNDLEQTYVREAKRDGAIAALIAQERQLVPKQAEEWEQAHRTIQKPTLILWGREDKLVPVAQGTRLSNDISGSSLVVFPETGHSAHLECPQKVLAELLPFLRELRIPDQGAERAR
jgi:pimeloyl-ACP methyl ester carboxylesterase